MLSRLSTSMRMHFQHALWLTRVYLRVSCPRLQLGEAGMQALITLGAGDMRRTLNIFQVGRAHFLFQLTLYLLCTQGATGRQQQVDLHGSSCTCMHTSEVFTADAI